MYKLPAIAEAPVAWEADRSEIPHAGSQEPGRHPTFRYPFPLDSGIPCSDPPTFLSSGFAMLSIPVNRRRFLQGAATAPLISLARPQTGWAETAPNAGAMVEAAKGFLGSLDSPQRSRAEFAQNNSERFRWHFVPMNDFQNKRSTRKGLPLQDMTPTQRKAADALLASGTSADGFRWMQEIMDRESMLAELEPKNVWFRRPDWYFFSVYGTPGSQGRWGWRVDGHHLAANFTVQDGKLISASPFFLGLNPVTVKHGPRAGERKTITECEDVARSLYLALTPEQQKVAHLEEHVPEVAGMTARIPAGLPTQGASVAKFTAEQRAILEKLIGHYLGRMPDAVAAQEKAKMQATGLDKAIFVYSGEPKPGSRHTYIVRAPGFLIHYLNEQTDPQKNPANHIHSIYRSTDNDFGGDTAS